MKGLTVQLEHGPANTIDLHEGDSHFLIIRLISDSQNSNSAFLSRREAEWFKKLLDMHLDRDDYENDD
ncbi:MAG: hypothetical protein V4568_18095 [Pseudomonadota bacterium]